MQHLICFALLCASSCATFAQSQEIRPRIESPASLQERPVIVGYTMKGEVIQDCLAVRSTIDLSVEPMPVVIGSSTLLITGKARLDEHRRVAVITPETVVRANGAAFDGTISDLMYPLLGPENHPYIAPSYDCGKPVRR